MNQRCLSPLIALALLLSLTAAATAAELSINGQNQLRYARGSQPGQPADDYAYFENYLDLNFDINKFRVYLRQGYRLPSEFGVRLSGLDAFDKRYIEYHDQGLTLRGGDFYRTWGRGLLFGSVEQLELDYDSGLEGLLLEGSYQGLDGAAYRGVEADSTGDFREAAEGAYLSYKLPWLPVRAEGLVTHLDAGPRHPALDRLGFQLGSTLDFMSFDAAYSTDRLDRDIDRYYHGFYATTATWFGSSVLALEYKDYRLFTYSDPAVSSAAVEQPALQNPPTAMPETIMYLLDRHPRIMRYGDDVGFQVNWQTGLDSWQFLLNYNRGSVHDGSRLFPSMREERSPYQTALARVEYDPYDAARWVAQAGWQQNVEFTATTTGGYSAWFDRLAAGAEYDWRIDDINALDGEVQFMREEDKARGRKDWFEYYGLTYSRSPWLSLTVGAELTEKPSETGGLRSSGGLLSSGGKYWPSADVTVDFLERHKLNLFVGYERGGLRCSGGSCRQVNPFKGVKVTMTTRL